MDNPDKPTFRIRKVSSAALLDDLSNLNQCDFYTYRSALTGPKAADVLDITLNQLRVVAQRGTGLTLESLSTPTLQKDLTSCQTHAFINGIQAWLGPQRVSGLLEQVATIQQRAMTMPVFQAQTGERDFSSPFSPEAVALVLQEMGFINFKGLRTLNPIALAEELFVYGRFIVRQKLANWHTTTLLPHKYIQGRDIYTIETDSLTGTQRPITAGEFMLLASRKDPTNEKFCLCEVV